MDKFLSYLDRMMHSVFDWSNFVTVVFIAGLAALIVAVLEISIDSKRASVRQILRNKKSAAIDIGFWFFHYSPVFALVAGVSTLGLLNVLKFFLHTATENIAQMQDGLLLFFTLFLVHDLVGYWVHRWMHAAKILWKFHEFHHSARTFNIFTVHRVHPVDSAVIKFFQTLVVLLLGASNVEVFVFTFITLVVGTLKHSNLVLNYPGIFKHIIQSPGQHWIHHSENPLHYDKNFGEILQVWDCLFGTAFNLSNEELQKLEIGTRETSQIHDRVSELFLMPYRYALRTLRHGSSGGVS